eukprot:Gb_41010 [translate_table: standard]
MERQHGNEGEPGSCMEARSVGHYAPLAPNDGGTTSCSLGIRFLVHQPSFAGSIWFGWDGGVVSATPSDGFLPCSRLGPLWRRRPVVSSFEGLCDWFSSVGLAVQDPVRRPTLVDCWCQSIAVTLPWIGPL